MSKNKKIQNISDSVRVMKAVYPQVYSYTLPEFPEEDGWQKIGYTERRDVDQRIREQTRTAAKTLKYEKLWHAPALKIDHKWFKDKDFHRFLQQKGVPRSTENSQIDGTEKFFFNGTPQKSRALFDDFVNNRVVDFGGKTPYQLRPEQKEAVEMTVKYSRENQTTDFENPNPKANFLWNAKPRFGKTLTTYDFAKNFINSSTGEKGAKSVLIMTNRPAIADSWYKDYDKFIDGYHFISTVKNIKDKAKTYEEFQAIRDENKRKIVFLSLQDFKGGKGFGGKFDKLEWVSQEEWDLLVIDEAHEGADTEKMDRAVANLKARFSLHLSGTPFRQIADGRYSKEQIYNWTYLDEQKAKQEELLRGEESGAHTDMPDMKFFAYEMSQTMLDALNQGVEIDGEKVAFAYDGLNQFFEAKNGKFVHEADVRRFLDLLTQNTKYPFSTPELREELKHTFWWVGNRVESVKAMKNLLATHPVFENYEVIAAVGKGSNSNDDYEEESSNEKDNRESLAKVRDAIKNHDKTITLSVGQLTTGVTVKEWSAVLMMSDTKSDTQYTQAIFRAQNPYSYTKNGQPYNKKSAYVFDFALVRILETYDKLANSLVSDRALGELTDNDRQDNNRELLNYMPVIAQDESGEMVELDASQVLTFPKASRAKDIVNGQFIRSNYMFADGLNVWRVPTMIRSRLNKIPETKDDGKKIKEVDVDDSMTGSQKSKQRRERQSRNMRAIFGDRIYGNEIDEAIRPIFEVGINQNTAPAIAKVMMQEVFPEPIAKWVETYNIPKAEAKAKIEKAGEEARVIAENFISNKLKKGEEFTNTDKNALVAELANFMVEVLPSDTVGASEKALNDKEDQEETSILIRKLKTFTRAIPILVMASGNPDELNLHNIEQAVDDATFIELFTERHGGGDSINEPFTKEDFRMLRDGGEYPEPDGTMMKFNGCFDVYSINAAIKEFIKKLRDLANYLETKDKRDIFTYIAPQRSNQIFTPRDVINQMLNILEKQNPGIFENPNITFCDPYIKSGMYLTEIAKRLNRGLADKIPDERARIKHIFENQLYGFTPSKVIDAVARRFIYGVADGLNDENLIQKDLTEDFKSGKGLNNMKFDVVIGNPPYNDDAKQQIYTDFYVNSLRVADNVCMIFPVGWQEPKSANGLKKMNTPQIKQDRQIVRIDNIQNAFPGVSGAEWTNIILWKKGYDNGLSGKQWVYTNGENPQAVELLTDKSKKEKPREIVEMAKIVESFPGFVSAQTITSVLKPYGLRTDVIRNPSKYGLPEMFTERKSSDDIVIYGLENRSQVVRYLPKYYPMPKKTECFNKYKVFIGKAWGNFSKTHLGGSYADIVIARPNEICAENFLESGRFDDFDSAKKHSKYLMTQFVRALLFRNKHSQDNSKDKWISVPVQDFSEPWWDLSIKEIDQELMKKYNIPDDIQKFVFENVQKKDESNIVNMK